MQSWREIYLDLFATAKSGHDVFRELSAASRELGFEHCSFGMRVPFPISNPRYVLQSDYPEAWKERYIRHNYFAVDPTVQHGLTQSLPLTWQADGQTESTEFWEEAAHHGLRYGWCMPACCQNGTIGLVTMARSDEPIEERELLCKEYRMLWLASAVNSAMNAHLLAQSAPEYEVELTCREREALKWSAAGKTYVEIGMIMSVDDRTVKFHLVNTMRKLNAMNKTEAAVKAAMLGLLW
ncbi:autoinducer binding domain-containing protein [Burkholderia gladioli]|uniref:Transcriptional regulator, LuxR family n=1 Tax=Burkholderia gladioli (strain BSR3) TaxID=999541 RepID=F2LRS3_BURGS|nr:autoinducer binding domain-containing protein [Burkholderia gladioli]AEA65567.1 transcriptional regulator, LuxR family [Burkholderia gladioli BSR3]MBW5286694.1 autoinducer binding domain-containing protein [Burkholderia gladioli]